MHRTTIHTLFFRLIYNSPKRSDIHRCVHIGIHIVSAVITPKRLVFSIANVMANRTRLTGVCRFNNNQLNAIQNSFVFQKRTELTERPTTKFRSKLFVSTFRSKPNVGQIFNSNSFTLFFCRLYNVLGDSVILNCCRSSFFTFKPFQEFSTASFARACFPLRAFSLNRTTNLLSFFSVLIKPFGRMFSAVRSYSNVRQTEVHTQECFHILYIIFHYINRLKQIELTLSKKQISFAFNVRKIILVVADKWHLQPAANRPDGNSFSFVRKNTTVVCDAAKWFKRSLYFLIQFVSISYLADTPYKNLCRKIGRTLQSVIDFRMDFKLVKDFLFPRYFRNSITNRIRFFNSSQEQISLFFSGQKFNLQRKFHNTKIVQIFEITKSEQQVAFLPPTPSAMNGFPAPIL